MPAPTDCPNCRGRLETAALGPMQDKHLRCPYCDYQLDVPDEYEVSRTEETTFPGGRRRVEVSRRRRDLHGDEQDRLREVLGEHMRRNAGHPGVGFVIEVENAETGKVEEYFELSDGVEFAGDPESIGLDPAAGLEDVERVMEHVRAHLRSGAEGPIVIGPGEARTVDRREAAPAPGPAAAPGPCPTTLHQLVSLVKWLIALAGVILAILLVKMVA